ncbi:hypothetical protein WOC76_21505 [Methylocystis sp. IM3]|jgi:hypothetical protein|uniref:hypothetical protein n=1 Tax=unclassified Methylocystis TaxID=2625913 RepID=UPI0030FA7D5F
MEVALVFTSRWFSNFRAMSTIADPVRSCIILPDASNLDVPVIEGLERSRAESKNFHRNDLGRRIQHFSNTNGGSLSISRYFSSYAAMLEELSLRFRRKMPPEKKAETQSVKKPYRNHQDCHTDPLRVRSP